VFEKKPHLPFEVPRKAAETDTPSILIASDIVHALSNHLDQFGRLVVPGTRRFNGHRI